MTGKPVSPEYRESNNVEIQLIFAKEGAESVPIMRFNSFTCIYSSCVMKTGIQHWYIMRIKFATEWPGTSASICSAQSH